MTSSDNPIQPDSSLKPTPALFCPDCGVPMIYRGERKQPTGSRFRDDIFYCPNCRIEILRPRKVS